MRYMGSKRRIADEILPIILKGRKANQWYVEPFVGGCNTMERVDGKRIGGDIHPELIAMYKALQKGWVPPKMINEDEYKRIMKYGEPHLKGYAGFTHSFGGKYGSTYRRHNDQRTGGDPGKPAIKGHYKNISYVGDLAKRMVLELIIKVKNVNFYNLPYYDLNIPSKSIVYCDPPYESTSGYEVQKFYHDNFWEWCRGLKQEGHKVFISEYKAPSDFKCVWSKEINNLLNNPNRDKAILATEKLFTL
jgi:DNA adenine methylase